MSDECDLPAELMRYLPDSTVNVASWDGVALALNVIKEIGPEQGRLEFGKVSHVNLPPTLQISGIEIGSLNQLPLSFFDAYRPGENRLDPDEKLFLFHGSWGEEFFVIACTIRYDVSPEREQW